MKTRTEKLFVAYFNKLMLLIEEALKDGNPQIKVWVDNISKLPFVYMDELSEEDLMKGCVFKGVVDPWSDGFEEFLDEKQKEERRARFSFSHGDIATITYLPSQEPSKGLKCLVGTWEQITGSIFGFIKNRACDIPEMPGHLKDICKKN